MKTNQSISSHKKSILVFDKYQIIPKNQQLKVTGKGWSNDRCLECGYGDIDLG
ncbi:hypothetical protein [Aquimarina algicola]|uniref:hypothetical protein n=1 Tax=Aquimarina algicola TaxID=2589995 RepID=UPI001CF5E5D4|nr:hypothetical protein [Aquimarina algicola]